MSRILKRHLAWLAAVLLALVFVTAACAPQQAAPAQPAPAPQPSPAPAPAPTPAPAPKAPAAKRGGTLVLMGHQEISSLSPQDSGPTVHRHAIEQIMNPLVQLNHNYEFEKVLAEDYSVSADGLTYVFKLRKGVKFHDGSDFTAKDVKYTFDWYGDPNNKTVIGANFKNVAKTELVDDHTVRVTMKAPDVGFMINAAGTYIVPAAYHAKVGEDVFKTKPIGTGPFKLKEWRAAEYTLLEAFDQHFRGRPNLDAFRINIVPEASVRAVAMQTGEAHMPIWPMLAEDNLKAEKDPKFVVYRTSSTAVNHFPLNNKLFQLSDKRVRQAMMYATDRQRMINDVFKGTAVVATANIAPGLPWYEPNVKQYPYDVNKAKELLEEAGWKVGADGIREKDGKKLAFTITVITGDQARKPQAEFLQQAIKQVGINAQIREAPVATILAQLPKGEMDASLFNWTYGSVDPDASGTLKTGAPRNYSQYSNPRVDELLEKGVTELDLAKRKAIYSEIQKLVAEDVPFLYMSFWHWYNVVSTKVKGLPPVDQVKGSGDLLMRQAYKAWLE